MERAARRTSPVPAQVPQLVALEPGAPPGPRPGAPLEPRFTIAVVRGAPLGVPQDLIGFGDLFELRFGGVLLPRRDAVGMVLHREAAVGLLDLGLVRVALDPQDG